LDDVYGHKGGVREDGTIEALKEENFFENIRQIHIQVPVRLNKSQERYKA
jgi:hypothetical protein